MQICVGRWIQVTIAARPGTTSEWVGLYERLAARGEAEPVQGLGDAAYFARRRDLMVLIGERELTIQIVLRESSWNWAPGVDKSVELRAATEVARRILAKR